MPTYRIASLNFLFKTVDLENRLALFEREMQLLNPDIVCLQEINDGNLPQITAVMTKLGYPYVSPNPLPAPKHWQVTFTRQAALHQHIDLGVGGGLPATLTVTKIDGVAVHVLNAHLLWGGTRAGDRLRQASTLADYAAKNPHVDHILLAGDLNTDPESATIRYLTGQQPNLSGDGTYWVDACKLVGGGGNLATVATVEGGNPLAAATAINHGHDPAMLPIRRIDYIFSHGWRYGGPGTPVGYGRFANIPDGETYISDHYGIWADILY